MQIYSLNVKNCKIFCFVLCIWAILVLGFCWWVSTVGIAGFLLMLGIILLMLCIWSCISKAIILSKCICSRTYVFLFMDVIFENTKSNTTKSIYHARHTSHLLRKDVLNFFAIVSHSASQGWMFHLWDVGVFFEDLLQ